MAIVIVDILYVGNRNMGDMRPVAYHYLVEGKSSTGKSRKCYQEFTDEANSLLQDWESRTERLSVNSISEMRSIIEDKYNCPVYCGAI